MSRSFELDAPDHFTAGAVGPPGQRVFYLQARQGRRLVTLKCEKEHVRALGEHFAGLLGKLPPVTGPVPREPSLVEPVDAAWDVGALGVGWDEAADRVVVEARESVEPEEEAAPARARFRITRAQAAAFVARAQALARAGRPLCPMCRQPVSPGGHACPQGNGHVLH
ncbi:MAG: hypothetical protein A2W08_13850 [Candidatus Rokubacteria bacterium RBG_16_73_20]|nr:MAG: hypothetical protein A2W08_13850 [Candidatus Rokubacteria bacterium RBG_16_73_20]HBH03853.1 DUF3090 domain-containing protein [Candidatus Rokubacteria bacterium]